MMYKALLPVTILLFASLTVSQPLWIQNSASPSQLDEYRHNVPSVNTAYGFHAKQGTEDIHVKPSIDTEEVLRKYGIDSYSEAASTEIKIPVKAVTNTPKYFPGKVNKTQEEIIVYELVIGNQLTPSDWRNQLDQQLNREIDEEGWIKIQSGDGKASVYLNDNQIHTFNGVGIFSNVVLEIGNGYGTAITS